ncbi:MAG: nitroreductase family deazaflavin-dependent oxidoreductase [Deltaproteobacteria bacterium]|nr:nitroreductase family deazaflavin-dependent oxidoreductase [Deltaproteobacteria bacterium]
MPNPLAGTKFYARVGNLITRPLWSILPAPAGFGILTTVGRRSGKARRQSVRAIRDGDQVFVVCMMGDRANWLRNIRACPEVTIRLGDRSLRGTARDIVDVAERQRAAEVYVGTTNASDYLDYAVYHWSVPTYRRVERAHRRWFDEGIPVVIELERGR